MHGGSERYIAPHHELPANVDDGFKGVERRRNRIKRFFLSGIAASVKEINIRAYLEKRNVKPTHISILVITFNFSEYYFII